MTLCFLTTTIILSVCLARCYQNQNVQHVNVFDSYPHITENDWNIAIDNLKKQIKSVKLSILDESDTATKCPTCPDSSVSRSAGPSANYFETHPEFQWRQYDVLVGSLLQPPLNQQALDNLNFGLNLIVVETLPNLSAYVTIENQTECTCLNSIKIDFSENKALGAVTVYVKEILYLLNHLQMKFFAPQTWISPGPGKAMVVAQLGVQAGFTLNLQVRQTGIDVQNGSLDISFAACYATKFILINESDAIKIESIEISGPRMSAWEILGSTGVPHKIAGTIGYLGDISSQIRDEFLAPITAVINSPNGLLKLNGQTFPGVSINNIQEPFGPASYYYLFGVTSSSIPQGITALDLDITYENYSVIIADALNPDDGIRTVAIDIISYGDSGIPGPCQNVCGGLNGSHNKGCYCCDDTCPNPWCNCELPGTFLNTEELWLSLNKKCVIAGFSTGDNSGTTTYIQNFSVFGRDGNPVAGPFNNNETGIKPRNYAWFGNSKYQLTPITHETELSYMIPGIVFAQAK